MQQTSVDRQECIPRDGISRKVFHPIVSRSLFVHADDRHHSAVHLTVGALADSGHEYTLKQFLQTARTDKRNLEMCPFLAHTRNRQYDADPTQTSDSLHTSSKTSFSSLPSVTFST